LGGWFSAVRLRVAALNELASMRITFAERKPRTRKTPKVEVVEIDAAKTESATAEGAE